MLQNQLEEVMRNLEAWQFPALAEDMPHGDMPGDRVIISEALVPHAQTLFRLLISKMKELGDEKVIISIFGGSGSGKSVTTSLLT